MKSNPQTYETIGSGYSIRRIPDPRIAAAIRAALGDACTVCNVGAGTGSYEPSDLEVTAVEPSETMIAQRASDAPVIRATAESLPFEDNQFDAAMAVLSVHHWESPRQGISEMKRVSKRQVIFTFDPKRQDSLWLVRDYLPEIVELENDRALSIDSIVGCLGPSRLIKIPIPHDCTDGFQAAYWRRPEWYLRNDVRSTISTLAQLPKETVDNAMLRLRSDLDSGTWHRRYAHLLTEDAYDFGYRLIVAG